MREYEVKRRKSLGLFAIATFMFWGVACGPQQEVRCGEGTVLENGECVPAGQDACGPDEVMENGECVPADDPGCESGEIRRDSQCLAPDALCDDATTQYDQATGTCVSTSDIMCGPGTVLDEAGETCVLDDGICPDGYVVDNRDSAPEGGPLCIAVEDYCPEGQEYDAENHTCFTPPDPCANPTTLGGEIRDDTTLEADTCYRVTETIKVFGVDAESAPTLTIEPGVILEFVEHARLHIGDFQGRRPATLVAAGTAANPILMTGVDKTPGYWGGLRITSGRKTENTLQHIIIEYGGGQGASANLQFGGDDWSNVRGYEVENCTFRYSSSYGVDLSTKLTLNSFKNNVMVGNASGPIRTHPTSVSMLDDSSTYGGPVEVTGGFSGRDVHWKVLGNKARYEQITAGAYHTCGLKADGSLECWGNDRNGQVSDPNGASGTYTQLSAGDDHTCALGDAGTIECWGADEDGQVSGPNGASGTYTQVSAGDYHTCALKTDGTVTCWGVGVGNNSCTADSDCEFLDSNCVNGACVQEGGSNNHGQALPPANTQFDQIAAGSLHTCGIKQDRSAQCWGSDGDGQVSGPNGASGTYTQLSAGSGHTCALDDAGTIECWGFDSDGQVSGPNGASGTYTQLSTGGSIFFSYTCALDNAGTVTCWGADGHGQSSPPDAGYRITDNVVVGDNEASSFIIDAGVRMYFNENVGLRLRERTNHSLSPRGHVDINGTEASPVIMDRAENFPGLYWRGIEIEDTNTARNHIEHLTLRHAGGAWANSQRAVISLGSTYINYATSVSLSYITLENTNGAGFYAGDGFRSAPICNDIDYGDASPKVDSRLDRTRDNFLASCPQ